MVLTRKRLSRVSNEEEFTKPTSISPKKRENDTGEKNTKRVKKETPIKKGSNKANDFPAETFKTPKLVIKTSKQSSGLVSKQTPKKLNSIFKSDNETPKSRGSSQLRDLSKPSCSKVMTKKSINKSSDSSSSESDIDWEEVPDAPNELSLEEYNPVIPADGVEIIVDNENVKKKRKRKGFDFALYARRQLNRYKKDIQMSIHKVHLLGWIAHGIYLNNVINSEEIRVLALSFCTDSFEEPPLRVTRLFLDKLLKYFHKIFVMAPKLNFVYWENTHNIDLLSELIKSFHDRTAESGKIFCLLFISLARALNLEVRLCLAAFPISHKPTDLLKSNKIECLDLSGDNEDQSKAFKSIKNDKTVDNSTSNVTSKPKNKVVKSKIQKTAKESDHNTPSNSRSRRSSEISSKIGGKNDQRNENDSDEVVLNSDDESEDDDFACKRSKNKNSKRKKNTISNKKTKPSSIKIISPDLEEIEVKIKNDSINYYWTEVFVPSENKWICIDIVNANINKPREIEGNLQMVSSYMIGIDQKGYIRDLTMKYASNWLTFHQKRRADPEWWEETIEIYRAVGNKRFFDEEKEIQAVLLDTPMPKTVGEYKNHPLYALKRHLLKFEAIYPPDAPTMGFVRSEAVYARECVHTLHSRETWMKQAKVVKKGEVPYKIVKARPKWDKERILFTDLCLRPHYEKFWFGRHINYRKMAGEFKTDLPLEIFGPWQTEPYIPPPAKDGKVPRNEYGNIELFQPSMLPAGTVHLQLAGLNRIARKLGLDCAPALVGFDGHCGSVHPVFDGFIVCTEFKEVLLAAWDEEQENIRKREVDKREKRIYGNWKKLIKGLLIREKIKLKYGDNS